ncbi:MAG: hypothetical protein OXI24_07655 [Candidatus Poribacteria bacterium]|nr:hypothetical protein [Candidatus Poribacteria bacterium]
MKYLPCRIWNIAASGESLFDRDVERINSPRAGGWYLITLEAITRLPQLDERGKARLTTWLVDQHRLGVKYPEILQQTITEVEQQKDLSVHDRADRLLQYIGDQTVEIGTECVFTPEEMLSTAIAAWSESLSREEVQYLLNYLDRQGWIALRECPPSKYKIVVGYTLTVEGYSRLAELEKANAESSKGFVAMWFDDSTAEAWEEGIKLGIEDAGYEAVRIDQKEHVNKIDDEIIAEIRRSRFVVADFTQGEDGARGGVYYEAGFAHGLGIEVIFACREDALQNVHFDTRQYNHIVWKKPEELRQRLAARISAIIGDGPHKENSGN